MPTPRHQHGYECLVNDGRGGLTCSEGQGKRSDPSPAASLRKLNDQLHTLTYNRYERHVPLGAMYDAVRRVGFDFENEEETPFALTGHDGKADVQISHPRSKRSFWLHITWHRMDSENFETVAYAN